MNKNVRVTYKTQLHRDAAQHAAPLRMALSIFSAVAALTLHGGVVAWYHFDEVAPGTPVTSDVRFLNAVDPTKLPGTPYSVGEPGTTSYGTLGNIASFMPTATNDVADTVYVVDPVGGTTNRNERSLYFTYADDLANNKPARYGGCVQVASDSSLSLNEVTVEFFVRPLRLGTMTNNGWQLVAKQSSGNNATFTYSICLGNDSNEGMPYVNCYDSSGTLMNTTGVSKFKSSRSILDGRWHHVALTVSNTVAKLYVDYALAKSVTLTEPLFYNDTAPLYIGASQQDIYKPGGFIDEVRISDTMLAPSQFQRYHDPAPTRFSVGFEGSLDAAVIDPYRSSGGASPVLAGTGGKMGDDHSKPAFSAVEFPGPRIVDGLGNVLRKTNTRALRFVGSTVHYPHNPGLEMAEMTAEFFMKHEAADNYASLLRFNQATNNWGATPIWNIGYTSTGNEIQMRIDTTKKTNQVKSFGSTFLDGKWHHVAVTFQQGATSVTVRMYDNYSQVGTDWSIAGRLNYANGSCLGVGTTTPLTPPRGFTGWIDEIRISRGVLPVDAFMRILSGFTVILR